MDSAEEADDTRGQWGHSASTPAWALDWGRLLRAARQVAGLSLTELSARTQLSKGYLSKLESGAAGAANPSRTTLAALARALPSFGPIAHMFGPDAERGELDFDQPMARPRPVLRVVANPGTEPGVPVALGWRALELLTATLVLEAASIPATLTAPVLARALGRAMHDIRPVLDDLVHMRLLVVDPPARLGGQPSYRTSDDASERLGIARLGDLLVHAAALLAAAPSAGAGGRSGAKRDTRSSSGHVEADDE